jgi:L-lactate dehydrogenase (cytochrome)
MHDMTARIAAISSGHNRSQNFLKHQRWFPTIYDLRRGAKKRLPHFAYEYGDGGAGDDTGIRRNWSALDSIEMVPRYGVMPELPPVNCELFGRKYSAPLGVAPMGSPIVVWPGADKLLAAAAQRAKVPYTLGVAGGATIEEIIKIAPDVMWLQLYRFAKNNHAIGFDLLRRADAAGVHVVMLTLDVPVRTIRAREVKVGLGGGGTFRPDWRMVRGMMKCPGWGMAMLRNNLPRFANIHPYAGPSANLNDTIRFARKEMGGAFSWDEVKRYRDRWKKPMIVKGILHPEDAEKAVQIGVDGIVVSNHGGRQIEALPAPIDCVPAVVRAVGSRATVLFDSGVRSGTDVARALALGAKGALAGKAFLWGLGALGSDGPGHVIDLMIDELQSALGQIGAHSPDEAKDVIVRHPGAYDFGLNHP